MNEVDEPLRGTSVSTLTVIGPSVRLHDVAQCKRLCLAALGGKFAGLVSDLIFRAAEQLRRLRVEFFAQLGRSLEMPPRC